MKKINTFIFFFSGIFLSLSAYPCSNVMVSGDGFAAVARSMDLEANTGNLFGLGLAGEKNTSNINIPQQYPIKAITWKNKYSFLGQTGFGLPIICDGINSQGLYAGFLYLPGMARYPNYNPKDNRRELAVTNTINYILGTSRNVTDALKNLNHVQLVFSAVQVNKKFATFPVHLVIRDKTGHSAVIEWVNHKTRVYDNAGPVLTNSPSYPWQVKNAKKYNYTFTGNTNKKWDGLYMNGSGFYGIPGDWTPPSRFVRLTQVTRHMPKPANEKQALYLSYSALQSAIVPLGANSAASIWLSLSDLKNSTYYFRPIFFVVSDKNDIQTYKMSPAYGQELQGYNVKQFARKYNQHTQLPKNWIHVKIKQGNIAKNIKQLNAEALSPTSGKSTVKFKLVN